MFYLDGLLLLGLLFFRWALVDRMKGLIDARVFALVLLVPALLIFVPKVEMAYAVLLVAAMLARNRPELCAGYLLMLPMVPELSLEYSLGGLYIMRLSATSALAVGALLALLWTPRTTRLHSGKYDFAAAVLVLLFTLMNARGGEANAYLRGFADIFLTVGVPYIIVSRSIGSESDARVILSRFFLAGALAALIAIFEASRHWALYEYIPSHLNVSLRGISMLNVRAGFMRSGGPFLNPTAFAFFLAILPAGLWGVRSYFHALGYRAVMMLLLAGLLATQSRGAWIACAAGYCALWAYRGLRGRAVGALFGAAVLYTVASLLLPENGRLAESLGRSGAAVDTMDYRRALLESGLAQVRAHPLLGQSASELNVSMVELVQGQGLIDFVNTHLFVALSGGLLGFVIWLVIWGIPFAATWRHGARIGKSPASGLQVVPETMLVVSMVALLFTSTANRGLLWPVVALALTAPLLSLARQRQKSLDRKARPLIYNGGRSVNAAVSL
ncbi:O-antigen ligase family protein [Sphingomonas sp. Leaf357]|uniref:O-antigen ligase family protein n=1 Tax=Sphingomonas sp. Leaf357 TaxID=1736350 RepID=UPI0012E1B1C2|nr:O-antigen ligase family protein [Sphingomonas sp. Leaf357]